MRERTTERLLVQPEIADRYESLWRDQPVRPANLAATIGQNRVVFEGVSSFASALNKGTEIDLELRELAILRMAWNTQCEYEFGQHLIIGRSVGLTDDQMRRVTRPLGIGGWSEVQAAVLQMTDDLYATDSVSDESWLELTRSFTHAQIIELLALVAVYRMMAGLMNACAVPLDEGVPGWADTLGS
jgi:alkylhydroperoxidase family enzyme